MIPKTFLSLFLFLLLQAIALRSTAKDSTVIVPKPVSVVQQAGNFTIDKNTVITGNKFTAPEARYLQEFIRLNYGWVLPVKESNAQNLSGNAINLRTARAYRKENEYFLKIRTNAVEISGAGSTGLFYGIQTFLQILPPEKIPLPAKLQNIEIYDHPRFAYRGMHLDVSRHFFPAAYVKKYIDYLAAHKFNTFHWHLTDDQGWRIEIKKYPKLTDVGSCRAQTLTGRFGSGTYDGKKYCGYYTQAEIKDIVRYAADRHIKVIPEIEMPGHAVAALASYPELGCSGGPYKVFETWGVTDQVFCAGKENTFNFLESVLDEVIALFPSEYIHIGGDEAPKAVWKTCPHCQKRIKDNELKNEHELQGYFTKRIENYLNNKGRKIIGWDEILEGNIKPSATIMSWRGQKGGIEGAQQKHNVIMTPDSYVYLDYSQTRNEDSVTIGNYLPLEKVYSFEPIPATLSAEESKYIVGGQGNLWTEYITNSSKLEYMLFPRMSALSEALWTAKDNRNWAEFEQKVPALFKRYEFWNSSYSKAYYEMQPAVLPGDDNRSVYWNVTSKIDADIMLYDSVKKLQAYGKKEVKIMVDHPGMFRALMMESKTDGKELGTLSRYFHFNKATGKKISLASPPNAKYANSGAFALVNGIITTRGMSESSHFLGFLGNDMEAVIDLGEEQVIQNVTVNVFAQNESWIYLPSRVSVSVMNSADVLNKSAGSNTVEQLIDEKSPLRLRKVVLPLKVKARYLNVIAKNYGVIPNGKPGAGTRAWLFVDEIEVN